jgi:uncharacterized protein (DUF305 family)
VNKRPRRLSILLALISTLVISTPAMTAWRQDSHGNRENPGDQQQWSELKATMDRMHASMSSVTPSGDNDVDFVKLMLPHHQAAVEMAKTQLLHGKDSQIRRLAQEIITDQQSEIELMQLWLKQREPGSLKSK